MSICHCDKSGELIWTTNNCYLFKYRNKIDSKPVQLNVTNTGIHFVRSPSENCSDSPSNSSPSSSSSKFNQCYHFDHIARCTLISNSNKNDKNDDDDDDHNNNIGSQGQLQQREQKKQRSLFLISCCRSSSKSKSKSNYNLQLGDNQVVLEFLVIQRKSVNSDKIQRKQVLLLIAKSNHYEENLAEACLIIDKLDPFINKGHAIKFSQTKPLLILLNPASGKGKSVRLFNDNVRQLLDDCNVKYHVLTTKYANHALDFIQHHNDLVGTYCAIVTLSGDGLLFEVLNGFVHSLELSTIMPKKVPVPISIIPGGSGNGLARSLNNIFSNGGRTMFNQLIESTLHTIKGQPTPMDLVRITTTNKVYYSFLSFGWGLMADIDIESERLRFLGEPRFTIWSIYRSLALKRYRGRLSYLRKDSVCQEIRPINQPVPDEWITINDEFIIVYGAYQQYLNSTVKFAPDSQLDDETIYLSYISGSVSTCQAIEFLLALEDGSHTKLPFVHFIPCKAFRLTPEGHNDIMTIDGEKIPCSTIQGEIMPKLVSILFRNNNNTT
ncbi:sphingosine kinase 1-like [Dermatophagoides pteronyssinus]|uniref:sphingosine kinase 1-like n=1 Tax=Dermatophagoides pteronyssinus TaxID=6956 RepID=UPI003F66ED50